jgi:WXXGXW repeat (2 copies)
MMKRAVLGFSAALLFAPFAAPALAQVRVNIGIGVPLAPPPPRVEVVPAAPAPGYVWAPGYWAWHGDRHIWVHGRYIAGRPGYAWVGEHWEQRGPQHFFVAGHWEREHGGRHGHG